MERKFLDWGGNIAALVAVVVINWLANALPIAGTTTGAVSAKYGSLFTPAGFTFAIWGLIYALLLAFIIYQALPAQRQSRVLAQIGPWFKVSCVANGLWLIAWHLEWLMLTLLLMIMLLVCLVVVYRHLAGEPSLLQVPFSVYTAWITVATIANVSALQSALGLNSFVLDEVTWTLLKLAVAGAIAAIVSLRRPDAVFALTIAWAAYGISAGQSEPSVAGAAYVISSLALILAAAAVYHVARSGSRA